MMMVLMCFLDLPRCVLLGPGLLEIDIITGVQAVALKNGHDVATWTLQFTDDQSCPDPEVCFASKRITCYTPRLEGHVEPWWKAPYIRLLQPPYRLLGTDEVSWEVVVAGHYHICCLLMRQSLTAHCALLLQVEYKQSALDVPQFVLFSSSLFWFFFFVIYWVLFLLIPLVLGFTLHSLERSCQLHQL